MKKSKIRLTFNRAAWLTAAVLVSLLTLAGAPAAAQIDSGYYPVIGKWSRGAVDSVAWVDLANWKLVTRIDGGAAVKGDPEPVPWIPVAGDWDGTGVDTVQMFNVQDWRLVPLAKGPVVGTTSDPEPSPWRPVAGNWEGRGVDTVLVFDLRDGSTHRLEEGPIKVDRYDPEPSPWRPLAGNWDGKGIDTIATYRDDERAPDTEGLWATVAGDWQGRGIDSVAFIHRPTGTLVLPEEAATAFLPGSRMAGRGTAGGPASSLDKSLPLKSGCYQTSTNDFSVTKVFHYGAGGCTGLVLESWVQWTCCPNDSIGGSYSCTHVLKVKIQTYGYINC